MAIRWAEPDLNQDQEALFGKERREQERKLAKKAHAAVQQALEKLKISRSEQMTVK